MLQVEAKPRCTFVIGASGTGKTTFALRYLVADRRLKCRFLFDPEEEFTQRLNLPSAESEPELRCALHDGFVIYDPSVMFGEAWEDACEWYCGWVFDAASTIPGEKVLYIPEVWRYMSPNKIPKKLSTCIRMGRKRGLHCMFDTQEPNRVNPTLTNQVTELVSFQLGEPNALERVKDMGIDPSEVQRLPPGSFVALNRRTRGLLRGKIF